MERFVALSSHARCLYTLADHTHTQPTHLSNLFSIVASGDPTLGFGFLFETESFCGGNHTSSLFLLIHCATHTTSALQNLAASPSRHLLAARTIEKDFASFHFQMWQLTGDGDTAVHVQRDITTTQ